MMREGSAWHDVQATIKCITEHNVDSRHAILVSDDTQPQSLVERGHLDHIVRRAIQEGVNPVVAVQLVTINVAEYYRMDHDLGAIAPGRCADIVFVPELSKMQPQRVMVDGAIVAEGGQMLVEVEPYEYPKAAKESVHVKGRLSAADFHISAPTRNGQGPQKVRARVMEIIEAHVDTNHLVLELPVKGGGIAADLAQDVAKVASFERHRGTGQVGFGFTKGLGFKGGAVASTVAHDSHNLLVIGMNDEDMAAAGNALIDCGGGTVVVRDGKVLSLLPLPIAGLVSNDPVEKVAEAVVHLDAAWKELGSQIVSPFMTASLLALPVLPALRLTNRGLVDTVEYKPVELVVEEGEKQPMPA
jgi:adenine deaminase